MKHFLFILLFIWCRATAEELPPLPLSPDTQVGWIHYESSKPLTAAEHKRWQAICQAFGSQLLGDAKPEGFLQAFHCSGNPGEPNPQGPSHWLLQITEHAQYLTLDFQFVIGTTKVPVHAFSFKFSGQLLDALNQETVQKILARMIVEASPTGWAHVPGDPQKPYERPLVSDIPPIRKELLVYDLAFAPSSRQWQPRLRALLCPVIPKLSDPIRNVESFRVCQNYLPLEKGQKYWVQNIDGPNARSELLDQALIKSNQNMSILSLMDKLILDSFRSNLVGLRWGIPLNDNTIMSQANLLSILVEIRSGWLAGLRWYYDINPEVRRSFPDGQEKFAMKRASLGMAFNYMPPRTWLPWIKRFDVQPKIGLLDVKTRFAVSQPTGGNAYMDFNAKNFLYPSIEAGMESDHERWRGRLWTSFGATLGLVYQSDLAVTSQRFGADLFFQLYKFSDVELELMGFGIMEKVGLERSRQENQRSGATSISALSFNLFFMGGGITLVW